MRGNALFESNTVPGSGGGFYGGSCDKVALEDAYFRSNLATWGGETLQKSKHARRFDVDESFSSEKMPQWSQRSLFRSRCGRPEGPPSREVYYSILDFMPKTPLQQ